MKRIATWAFLGGLAGLLSGCPGDRTKHIPEGRNGGLAVAGTVRAESPHFRLMGNLGAAGGTHATQTNRLHDGTFVNSQLH